MADRKLLSEQAAPKKDGKTEGRRVLSEPGKFDLMAWVQGIKPVKRVVRLYQRLDLLGERDKIGELLRAAKTAGDDALVEDLRAKARGLTDQIIATSVDVTVQGVTQSKYKEIAETAAEDPRVESDADRILFHIAAQIVEPEGFTFEVLRMVDDQLPAGAGDLARAWAQVNSGTPDVEATVPF